MDKRRFTSSRAAEFVPGAASPRTRQRVALAEAQDTNDLLRALVEQQSLTNRWLAAIAAKVGVPTA